MARTKDLWVSVEIEAATAPIEKTAVVAVRTRTLTRPNA
jgi:hypothetical protein